ncbi:MAG: hypothetical protein WKF91_09390, partial [Segetibacter sp.]
PKNLSELLLKSEVRFVAMCKDRGTIYYEANKIIVTNCNLSSIRKVKSIVNVMRKMLCNLIAANPQIKI